MSSSGLRGLLGNRVAGSPLRSRCAGASTAESFATKPRGWSPSRGRAWRRRGERACPSAAEPGEGGRRGGPGSNPAAGTIDPRIAAGQFPATPVCSGGRASEAAPSHGHPRPGRQDPSQLPALPEPVPRVAEDAGAPQRPLYDTVAPQRVPISWAIRARPPLGDRGRERGQSKCPPPVEPQSLLAPEPIPRPGWPWGPRRGILPPGYQCAGQSVPRSHFPRELPACVDTTLHTRGGQPRIPGQPSRPVRLRVPPGSVPFPSRTGKLFSPPVAEWRREEHRHFTAPRTRTGLCRRGGRGPGTPWHHRRRRLTVLSERGAQPGPRDAAFSFPGSSGTTGETATGSDLRHRYPTVPPGSLPGSAGVSGPRRRDPGCAQAAATPTTHKTPEIPVRVSFHVEVFDIEFMTGQGFRGGSGGDVATGGSVPPWTRLRPDRRLGGHRVRLLPFLR